MNIIANVEVYSSNVVVKQTGLRFLSVRFNNNLV